jgi:hypothetical protein
MLEKFKHVSLNNIFSKLPPHAVPYLPLGTLGTCLERQILRGAKFWRKKLKFMF